MGARLGRLIEEIMEEKGLTEEEVGEAAGIEANTMSQIVTGDIDCPPLTRLEGIARGLSVPASRIIAAAEADGCNYSPDGRAKIKF